MSIAIGKRAEFQSAIMEKGFYPENLPPVFTVRNFYDAATILGLFDEDQIHRKKPLALARYSDTKRGGQRRIFSTPNPLFFIDTSKYILEHRSKLSKILHRSKWSRSIPRFDKNFDRAVRIDSFSEFTAFRRKQLSAFRYIVKADISRFFHSVYTHSIAWAVHGKSQAKKDRSVESASNYANKMDYLIRQCQDQQTVGIPVGPDTSRIAAELIAGAIDGEFRSRVGHDVVGARLVDDMYIGAKTFEEAEDLLSAYRDSIRRFELDIQENKTLIFTSKQDLEAFWPVSIRREIEGFSGLWRESKESDLNHYLDEIIRVANFENDDGIIKYAIRKMDDFKLWNTYWNILEPFLVRIVVNFPHCIDYVARVVSWKYRVSSVDERTWRSVCISTISYHAKLGNDSEVSWAIWLMKEIGGKLAGELCEMVVRRCGPFPVLLSIDLASRGAVSRRFPTGLVYERLGNHPMVGNDWLLSYEAERSFGFKLKTKNRTDYTVFGDLIQRDAQFYNPEAVPFVFQGVADVNDVDEALEDRIGLYEGEDNEGDIDFDALF